MSYTRKKQSIFLDLDSTLIYAEPTEDYNFVKNKKKCSKFKHHDMDGYYIVFERPGLQEFLDFLFKTYNVSVWTAASKDYALFVIDKIILKNDRKLEHILFSYHCDVSSSTKSGTKDLSTLWDVFNLNMYNKNNTVILDDYNEVHKTQPGGCIIVVPEFKFNTKNSENDDYLSVLMPHMNKLAKEIESGNSIGEVVKSINHNMAEWHKDHK